jgi:glycine cleavage system H lipoate-binding protein
LVNTAPYGDGWMFIVKLAAPAELNALLTPEQYTAQIAGA